MNRPPFPTKLVSKQSVGFAMVLAVAMTSCEKNNPAAPMQTTLPVTIAEQGAKPAPAAISPTQFVDTVDNRFFPLIPGTKFFYDGQKDGIPATNVTTVTHETKKILGVNCTVVLDSAYENGILVEATIDWYAQDSSGNVWYFGEDTKELDSAGNVVSTEGSWEAGVNGASPGIIMEAEPKVGDRYNQEFAPGVAEDKAQVRSLDKTATVPYGSFDDLLLTKEWTPLDPGTVDHKYYAENVGFILSVMVKGGNERSELVKITTGN